MKNLPLVGVRVLDFTHAIAGPFGTQMLSYFGAEVIKVESQSHPDSFRYTGTEESRTFNRGFAEFNHNKRDVAIDMHTEAGREIIHRLIAISDVIVENFSPGVLRRWGLTYEQLERPEIVVVSLPGMGNRGPSAHWATWGASLLAFSGIAWMWGYPDQQEPGGIQMAHPDYVGGILGAIGAIAALDERRRSGLGQAVELPQVAGTISLLPTTYLDYFVNARQSPRAGNSSPIFAPYGVYPCGGEGGDRWCVVAVTSEEEWGAFCRALGDPDWTKEARFQSMGQRVEHREALDGHVASWTSLLTPHQVMDVLQRAGVAAGAVQNGEDLVGDPHLRARSMVQEQQHPLLPPLAFHGIPIKLSRTPGEITRLAPELGEDNAYVFGELLGMDHQEMLELEKRGVLA